MTLALLLEWWVKWVVFISIVLGGFAYLPLFERRAIARFRVRIGPTRAGPWGLLQPVADGVKLIFKEELIPDQADKPLFLLAPVLTVVPVLILLAVVPLGPDITLFGRTFTLSLASEVTAGLLYLLSVASIA